MDNERGRSYTAPLRPWLRTVAATALLTACGDSVGTSGAGETTSTTGLQPSTGTAELPTTGTGGISDSDSDTTGGISDSMTGTTGVPTTGAVTTSGTTTDDTTTIATTTSGTSDTGALVCADPDPAPGMVAIDPGCQIDEMVGTWMPVIEWKNANFGNTYTTPAIANLTDDNNDGVIDGEDIPDIAIATAAGAVHVLSGDGAKTHWTAAENMGGEPSSATIADLDADGRPEVIVSGTTGFHAWHGDTGVLMWKNPVGGSQPVCGASSVYDLDGDGTPEVVQGNRIFDGQTGALRGTGAQGKGSGYGGDLIHMGVAADLDQDGMQEVVVGNAVYDADGNTLWSTNEPDGWVAVGNFDDDDLGEVVVAWYPGNLRLQDDDGAVIWTMSIGGSTIGAPTIADFDGDGAPEIGVAGQNRYAVIDGDGTPLWTKVIADGSGFTGSSVFDFNGDLAA